ncbi:MAG: DUF1064 domain-containing protein [Spirochaetales bacterium]|nr:DUF1064 domain-containing protein [Spirochaetales bacterium]MDY5914632.1 DUF1064 domain-containing protein [Treponema sp.]
MNKYHAMKMTIDGIVFDSKKEAQRYMDLKILERAGRVIKLERQVKFVLIPSDRDKNGKVLRAVSYIADFTYLDERNNRHVEDVKGVKTPVYKLKKRLMWEKYHIEVEEV